MDMARFDTRKYRTLPVTEGYRQWVQTYEDTVLDLMDLRLLERVTTVSWDRSGTVADLGCGTGRIGVWLRKQGVGSIDGIDLTPEMLDLAREKNVYRNLEVADVFDTGLESGSYDVVTTVLVDEHLPDVRPLYAETARIARSGGSLVIVGYHPFFLFNGIPTHFDLDDGESVSIQCFIHLFSDHVGAAMSQGWHLGEMHEEVIDEEWVSQKPKWSKYRGLPVSYAMVWHLGDRPNHTTRQ